MTYTLKKTYIPVDGSGNVVPDDPASAARVAYLAWVAAGNSPVKDDAVAAPAPAPAPTPAPPAPAPSPAPSVAAGLPWEANLTTYMDQIYGVGAWTKRTGVGLGSDIGPALIAACIALRSMFGRGTILIPPGDWLMKTAPTAAQLSGIMVRGAGSMASKVIYDCNTGVAFNVSGAGGFSGGGAESMAIMLEDGYPLSLASALLMQGDATAQPDQMSFKDLYITAIGNSYWFDGFKAFGNARTSPQGIRISDVNNVQVFRCRNTGIFLSNVVQWTLRNIGVYSGIGGGNNFYLAGGGAGNTNSTQVYADGLAINGELNVTNCSNFHLRGKCSVINSNSSASIGSLVMPGATIAGMPGLNVEVKT